MTQQIAEFYARISADTTGLQKGLADAKTGMTGLAQKSNLTGSVVGDLQKRLLGLVNPTTLAIGGFTALTGFMVSSTKTTLDYANQVRQLSQISGESTESTSRFLQVLDDYKISADQALVATRALTGQGHTPSIATLAKLSDQYLALNSAEEKNAFVLKNLGKGGLEWVNVLNQGSKALKEQGDAVNKNLLLTQKQVDNPRKAELAMDEWSDAVMGLKVSLGNSLLPVLTETINSMNNMGEATATVDAEYENLTPRARNMMIVLQAQAQSWEANRIATENAVTAWAQGEKVLDGLATSAEGATEDIAAMSEKNETFIATLSTAAGAWGDYRGGVAEARKELAEGSITTDQYKVKIGELAGAFEETKNSFVLSTVQMKLAADGVFDDKDLAVYLKVAKGLGLITAAQEAAAISWNKTADDIVNASQEGAHGFEHIAGRAEEAVGSMDALYAAQAVLASGIRSNSLPMASALSRELSGIPAYVSSTVDLYINRYNNTYTSVHGAPGGGGGAGAPKWGGGPLEKDKINIVGDSPGGGMTPYTEAIIGGHVYNAKETREMYDMGLLDGAMKMAVGGDLFGMDVFSGGGSGGSSQLSTTTRRRRQSSGTRVGNTSPNSAASGLAQVEAVPLSTQVDAIADAVATDVAGASIAAGAPAVSQETVLNAQANQTQQTISAQVQSSAEVVGAINQNGVILKNILRELRGQEYDRQLSV